MNYQIEKPMTLFQKLEILADAAKYDVACTSSGVDRRNDGQGVGNCIKAGICHSFSADGRCISLLKILMTNDASMTANTASTAGAMTFRGLPLLRRRSVI